MRGFHGGFPDLSFLLFAVPHNAKSLESVAADLSRKRDADRDAETLT
jgi:hypothetical protein